MNSALMRAGKSNNLAGMAGGMGPPMHAYGGMGPPMHAYGGMGPGGQMGDMGGFDGGFDPGNKTRANASRGRHV